MFIKSQCPWGRTSHHVQAENVGHSGLGLSPALGLRPQASDATRLPPPSDRPPPDPFPAFEWKPVPWAGTERSCLRGGGDRASQPDSRPEGRPSAGDVSAPSGQNTRRARVPPTSYRGKGRRPHDTTEWLLPPSVEWLQLYSLNTSEDRRTNAETGAKAD